MSALDRRRYIEGVYQHLLQRDASEGEVRYWLQQLERGVAERYVFSAVIELPEYGSRSATRLAFPPGHFHSPIVNPGEARPYVRTEANPEPSLLAGLDISLDRMRDFWMANRSIVAQTPFPQHATGGARYYYWNDVYPIGDATIYRLMLHARRPRRIVEVGSGFSTAVALDTLDELQLHTSITCIEPDPQRLFGLIARRDRKRITLINAKVQDVPLSHFRELDRDDILFIDSTHVIKTGSDVNHELFHVLPALNNGVLIHFHDIHYPFEYPDKWLYELNYSWNEVYALRAFLMHNLNYRIDFMTDLFGKRFPGLIEETFPAFLLNPGGSLWLTKQ